MILKKVTIDNLYSQNSVPIGDVFFFLFEEKYVSIYKNFFKIFLAKKKFLYFFQEIQPCMGELKFDIKRQVFQLF